MIVVDKTIMRYNTVPAIACSWLIPENVRIAITNASYAPIPPGVMTINPANEASPYAINKDAGFTTAPNALNATQNKQISIAVNNKLHRNG